MIKHFYNFNSNLQPNIMSLFSMYGKMEKFFDADSLFKYNASMLDTKWFKNKPPKAKVENNFNLSE